MSERVYDAIVAGLGAHGSAAAYQLAKRGQGVLGFDRFARGHTLASFGGLSRIIRLSYYEHASYVPLLKRAWDLWRELEHESGEKLLTQTGGLYMGPREGELVSGSLNSARTHGLAHELIDNAELRRRYPVFDVESDWVGLVDEQAGWLAPERSVEAHLRMAERHGATLRFAEPIESWELDGDGVRATSAHGTYRARRLVIAAGSWLPRLVPKLAPHLWVERSVLFWFEPRRELDAFAKLPVYIVEDTDRFYYGFPYDPGNGLKMAGLHFGDRVDPDTVDREPSAADEERVRAWLRRRMPHADGERRRAQVCLYTNSPDGHFIIDRDGPVTYASACSGHGFKFASAVGEILAQLVIDGRAALPIAFLAAARLSDSRSR
ncbi:MAG: N-methyl-L-tryptophan oxidase [Chloroflexota bacterium]|nr:N-methyl-L-tryptophan oxidase [Chloroflexota bacterium]